MCDAFSVGEHIMNEPLPDACCEDGCVVVISGKVRGRLSSSVQMEDTVTEDVVTTHRETVQQPCITNNLYIPGEEECFTMCVDSIFSANIFILIAGLLRASVMSPHVGFGSVCLLNSRRT